MVVCEGVEVAEAKGNEDEAERGGSDTEYPKVVSLFPCVSLKL